MKIAVEFDGTIVENKFPQIGKELPFAFYVLHTLQERGHDLVLWTSRKEQYLASAIEFCKERGLEFYTVNKNHPNENIDETSSRKIEADIFIDDKNIGGIPDWNKIFYRIHPAEERYVALSTPSKKWKRWSRWKRKRWQKKWQK